MVTRILASWYLTKQDTGYPATAINQNTNNGGPNVQGSDATVAKAVARDGIVLLKNTANALPLQTPKSIAIIGSHAVANPKGINSCVDSKYTIQPFSIMPRNLTRGQWDVTPAL
jgi:beta-glucosidase